jgi:hypothetical protein
MRARNTQNVEFVKGRIGMRRMGALLTTFALSSAHANAQVAAMPADAASAQNTTSTVGVQVNLPPLYEATIQGVAALATSGATALKTYRSDARSQAIRAALSKALLAVGGSTNGIVLDSGSNNPALGEDEILCGPRQNYSSKIISENYLNALVQNIDAVSKKAVANSNLLDALKLLITTSNYTIVDTVKIDPAAIAAIAANVKQACEADIKNYAQDYYGTEMPTAHAATAAAAAGVGIDFSFLGPIGTLINTFIAILQPVVIDAAGIVDEQRRELAIRTALVENQTKITETGKQLAAEVDNFSAASRHRLVGEFLEQLVSIRGMMIDLSKVPDCQKLQPTERLPSGAPDSAFIGCWSAAWTKLKPQVENLSAIGDDYDSFVDPGTKSANQQFQTIMANYKGISQGQSISIPNTLNEITTFVNFAEAIVNAASQTNINKLKTEASAAVKQIEK